MSEPAHDILKSINIRTRSMRRSTSSMELGGVLFSRRVVPHGVMFVTALPDKVRYNKGTSCTSSDVSSTNGEEQRYGRNKGNNAGDQA